MRGGWVGSDVWDKVPNKTGFFGHLPSAAADKQYWKKFATDWFSTMAFKVMTPIWHRIEDQFWPIPVKKQVFDSACPLLLLHPITSLSPGHPQRPGSNHFTEHIMLPWAWEPLPSSRAKVTSMYSHCENSYPAQDINFLNLITFKDETDVPILETFNCIFTH